MTEIRLQLSVRDLTHQDLPSCGWAGDALHVRQLADQIRRAEAGEIDYLAVCTPVGLPVAVGGIDYTVRPGAGTLWQLGVHPALRSCGIGTLLIRSAEQWIAARGLTRAELGVEEDNPRARALYERLGYQAFGREPDSWDVVAEDGSVRRYETMCALMRKDLA
ncbi:acetyltransferase (GNAT) family protein [Streptomyces sp. 2132.2]|uniref:GNAT family N-acetyltransferase n=1 Tax=Streptomyces sp. 2132.2 TaxID=2485161 RepID=UPI000F48C735|nr:GNAT family N-acetyltransferase [Streptomyces sp. 2132.2]ROR00379.1 acetyltransferase (GNAT) family protein [Streptomyces sp. 2132.2]